MSESIYGSSRKDFDVSSIIGKKDDSYSDAVLKETLTLFYEAYRSNPNDTTTSVHDACHHIHGFSIDGTTNTDDIRNGITLTSSWSNHTLSMLQKITATVLLDYKAIEERSMSFIDQEAKAHQFVQKNGPILNLQTVITDCIPTMALAAEYKRASPSKGLIATTSEQLDATKQAIQYMNGGANIISCLTEPRYFHGTIQDLYNIRIATQQATLDTTQKKRRPAMLRKDFVISKYMIAEAVANGADTVLLIVAILPVPLLKELIEYCITAFQLIPLVEIHTNEELDIALQVGATVIGINNRNLHTFQLDLSTSERIAARLQELQYMYHPNDIVSQLQNEQSDKVTTNNQGSEQEQHKAPSSSYVLLCALSGMSTCYDIDRYRKIGISMCLIGESLMRSTNPTTAIQNLYLNPMDFECMISGRSNESLERTLLEESNSSASYTGGTKWIKICGITNEQDALVACQSGANLIGMIFAEKSKRKITSIEQAKRIVDAVRKFGERSDRIDYLGLPSTNSNLAPINHIVQSTSSIVNSAKHRPLVVGVFQNQDMSYINEIVQNCGIDIIQLHGQEGMTASNRSNYYHSTPVIRVIDILTDPLTGKASNNAVGAILKSLTNDPSILLLDTAIKSNDATSGGGGGGTGLMFDWTIAKQIQDSGIPVIVAGGLTPASIANCIQQIHPFGIDVSSGVEQSPGIKDHEKLRSFIKEAKTASFEASKGF